MPGAPEIMCISICQLLDAIISQLLVDCVSNIHRSDWVFKCFDSAKNTHVATVRVPSFTQNVNLEILGFRSFPGTLEGSMAYSPLESYATTVFSSNRKNPITEQFLSNSPDVLMGLTETYNHPHFIILLQPPGPEEIITLPFSPIEFLAELFPIHHPPAECPVPDFSASSSSLSVSPVLPPDMVHLDSYREYLLYSFEQDTESAVYSKEGRTRRKLWFGIQNHRNACEVLKQAGFKNLRYEVGEFFELPNGTQLSISDILDSELGWDVATFGRKSRAYDWCTQYAASHCWSSHHLPSSHPPSPLGTRERGKWDEQRSLLKIWKGIVAMFGPEGYASLAEPPIASSDIQETFAANLTEGKLTKCSTIMDFLVRRGSNAVDHWF
ncbi:hypothetical protein BT96DRAFT_987413 [Gymnopus androsaceus JB14]|uniref:Uncharacterized protein n=1 Tax=Gymnopus androsaceus JB14 TaxID=1447944 RepID=A0A6A4ICU5_9AGAR|nr:hypothetical protein BT96DRAFT_987413 [Gymnopus androsaceus JB14]